MIGGRGLRCLLADWESFADSLAGGYQHGLDDYLNDLDARRMLAEKTADWAPERGLRTQRRLTEADAKVRAATEPWPVCLWGTRNAVDHGWQSESHWYYFAVPRTRSQEFDADLARVE